MIRFSTKKMHNNCDINKSVSYKSASVCLVLHSSCSFKADSQKIIQILEASKGETLDDDEDSWSCDSQYITFKHVKQHFVKQHFCVLFQHHTVLYNKTDSSDPLL